MGKASVEEQLAALQELRAAGPSLDKEAAATRLQPFIKQANNLVVAKAADLARELDLRPLREDLVAAFHRFLENPAKRDPQCWAKNALSKALHHFGYDDSRLFLSGLRLHQYEPVWGGQSDVAGTLRANCAHALVDCRELTHQALLLHLLEIVADADKSVRAEAMRAITEAGGDSAILLLRMRALTAIGEDPSVMGFCYAGLLALEGNAAVAFIAQFLAPQDESSTEAAIALGETRTPEALAALLQSLSPLEESDDGRDANPAKRRRARSEALLEPAFATLLLSAIALTRQPAAVDKLLVLVSEESGYAEAAIEALANARYGVEVKDRLADIIARIDNNRLTRSFETNFPG